jgi:phage-related protein
MTKDLEFIGDSLKRVQAFPAEVRRDAGYKLRKLQDGKELSDVKTLTDVAAGVQELRLWDESGTFRVVFVAKFAEAIYVLHAFQKKTQDTTTRDLDLVRKRYEEVRQRRKRL